MDNGDSACHIPIALTKEFARLAILTSLRVLLRLTTHLLHLGRSAGSGTAVGVIRPGKVADTIAYGAM